MHGSPTLASALPSVWGPHRPPASHLPGREQRPIEAEQNASDATVVQSASVAHVLAVTIGQSFPDWQARNQQTAWSSEPKRVETG